METAKDLFLSGNRSVPRRQVRFNLAGILVVLCIYFFVHSSPLGRFSLRSARSPLERIPTRIWQIYSFASTNIDEFVPPLSSWITNNQDFSYTLMSNDGADAFARKHYADRPEVLQPFLDLQFPIIRTDLLRYMLLESEGGIYSDLDTFLRKPIRDWISPSMRSEVHAIIGIEYDQLDREPYIGMTERLQFCQWTIAASRGHPIMARAVRNVIEALHALAERHHVTIPELQPTDDEVIAVSGPLIWTKAVMQSLSEATGSIVDYRNFTGMTEPRLVGDVLVLPIDGFGTGQPHSNAKTDESGDAYVRHMWKGSWKHNWRK